MSTINVFDLDLSVISTPIIHPQYRDHIMASFEPCNCKECVTYALGCGIIKTHLLPHPQTREMTHVPMTTEDATAILAMSPDAMSKTFRQHACDITLFASLMIENGWRAARKELAGGKYFFTDKAKRKAADGDATPSKKARPSAAASGDNADGAIDLE